MASQHHGDDADKAFRDVVQGGLLHKLGATGEFPEGRLNPDDEGEIVFGVARDRGKIILSFGTPVAWLGMDPTHARGLAKLLQDTADAAERELER